MTVVKIPTLRRLMIRSTWLRFHDDWWGLIYVWRLPLNSILVFFLFCLYLFILDDLRCGNLIFWFNIRRLLTLSILHCCFRCTSWLYFRLLCLCGSRSFSLFLLRLQWFCWSTHVVGWLLWFEKVRLIEVRLLCSAWSRTSTTWCW